MDPRHSAQDVVRCALCRDAVAPMYCSVCHTHLCGDCEEKHFSDKSKVHNVVPLEQFLSTFNYPKCHTHTTEQCELHCEQCNIPICSTCISSGKHIGHIFADIKTKKEVLRKDLEELEKSILPKYQELTVNIKNQKTALLNHSQNLTKEINKQGEALHREINTIIQRKQSDIDDMNAQNLSAIEKQEHEINKTVNEIKQVILELKSLLETSDIGHVSTYKTRNGDFRKLPPKLKISLPSFQHQKIDAEQILKQFGFFSRISIETEEQGYTVPSPGAESSPQGMALLDIPRLISDIPTSEYGYLFNITCPSDEKIWTSGDNEILKLYNLKGELLKSVQTKSGKEPQDITVIPSGDLVYADFLDRSINLVRGTGTQTLFTLLRKKSKIQTLITLQGWIPRGLCSTSSGDLLVTMISDDGKQTKVVRYSGFAEKQSIQKDDQGFPLYSSGYDAKYLSENRNLDICVADNAARAVVVVSAAGKLRFRYTGPPSTTQESFYPLGIITDSRGNILTSDYNNHRIHIIDQDGHFLRFIDNSGLLEPWGLSVDSLDNLFVAEADTGKVKKLQYYK